MIEVKVPILPESISEATVAVWHKKPGDFVELDDVIVEIETDKVVLEVPAEDSGVLTEIKAKEGETVGEQQVLGIMEKKPQDDSKEIPTAEKKSTKKEEPINQGAWYTSRHNFMQCTAENQNLDVVARDLYSAPAEGSVRLHNINQNYVIEQALGIQPVKQRRSI